MFNIQSKNARVCVVVCVRSSGFSFWSHIFHFLRKRGDIRNKYKKKKGKAETITYDRSQILTHKHSNDKIDLKIALDSKRRQKISIRLVNKKLHKTLRQIL